MNLFLLYFLDTYIDMVKNSQRVPLDESLNWRYLHQNTGKTYSEISEMGSYWKYSKGNTYKHMKKEYQRLSGYKSIIMEDHQNYLCDKREIMLRQTKCLQEDMENFCVKRVMVKAGNPPSINDDSLLSSAKGWPEMDSCAEEKNPDQK